jgi:hypothetical protein
MQQVMGCMSTLHKRFQVAARRAHNDAQGLDLDASLPPAEAATPCDDDSTVKGMVRLFLDATEAYATLIAQGSEQVRGGRCLQQVCCKVCARVCGF